MELLTEHYDKLLLMLVLACCSGLFSGSETALFSLTPADVNRLRRRGGLCARAALGLYAKLSDFLLTVLLCNLIVNILFFAISGTFAVSLGERYGATWGAAFGAGTVGALLLFAEVMPKIFGAAASFHASLIAGPPLALLHRLLWPIRRTLQEIVRYCERLADVRPEDDDAADELKLLFELGQSRGVLSRDENGLLTAVVELPEIRAGDIMTPRVDVACARADTPREEILQIARQAKHSKLPVLAKDGGEFSGWIDAREAFFRLQPCEPAARIVRKTICVSEFDRGDQILRKFLEKHARLALVIDERGGTAGILAISDLASEIFGELGDEDVPPAEYITAAGNGEYLLDGRLSLREWRTMFGIEEEFFGLYSLGGLVAAELGRQPAAGDEVRVAGMQLHVQNLRRRQCGLIRMTPSPAAAASKEEEGC